MSTKPFIIERAERNGAGCAARHEVEAAAEGKRESATAGIAAR
ncbi:hypothetical protein VSR69_31430 [Paraburkholderia phytofirmans]|jgi:hypothetical protein